jgi:hypothetical protein
VIFKNNGPTSTGEFDFIFKCFGDPKIIKNVLKLGGEIF